MPLFDIPSDPDSDKEEEIRGDVAIPGHDLPAHDGIWEAFLKTYMVPEDEE